MKRVSSGIIRLYARLLRLYPPQFRAEFGDEMGAVFAQAISETHDLWSLLGLCLGELRDLPVSLIREHQRERRQRLLVINSGGAMLESRFSVRLFQFSSISLFAASVAFVLMVVLPFFALGLHLKPALEVAFGALGPEAFAPYSANFLNPNPLPGLAIWVMLVAPIWGVAFGGGLLLMLGKFWSRLAYRYRLTGILAVLAGIIPILILLLPVGRILAGWWMD